jgi:hypothetical protein
MTRQALYEREMRTMMPNAAQSLSDFGWDFDNSYIRLPKAGKTGIPMDAGGLFPRRHEHGQYVALW